MVITGHETWWVGGWLGERTDGRTDGWTKHFSSLLLEKTDYSSIYWFQFEAVIQFAVYVRWHLDGAARHICARTKIINLTIQVAGKSHGIAWEPELWVNFLPLVFYLFSSFLPRSKNVECYC